MNNLQFVILALASIAAIFIPLFIFRRSIERKNERSPISEKLLRPAGESLRLVIEELDEKLTEAILALIAAPVCFLLQIAFVRKDGAQVSLLGIGIIAVLPIVGFVWASRRILGIAHQLRNHRLGFHGERAVAEELNQLMREGCYVFHDLLMEPYGNIDHVVVAPSGVYAVETKTRRKRKAPPGKKDHVVFYDGDSLEFPHCKDTHGLQQARQQADRLRSLLTKAVGEPVKVFPILTLPGWFVTNRVKPTIPVLSPKMIRGIIINGGSQVLSKQLIQRIAHQLELKCRDVEL